MELFQQELKKHLLRILRRDSNSMEKLAIKVFFCKQDIDVATRESENERIYLQNKTQSYH